jgi:hypothetical protein
MTFTTNVITVEVIPCANFKFADNEESLLSRITAISIGVLIRSLLNCVRGLFVIFVIQQILNCLCDLIDGGWHKVVYYHAWER